MRLRVASRVIGRLTKADKATEYLRQPRYLNLILVALKLGVFDLNQFPANATM
jgi:hypothetical protein